MKEKGTGIWYYIKSYKFSCILIRNFLLIILPTVIPLVIISAAIFNYNNANIGEEIKATNMSTLAKIKNTGDMMAMESDLFSAKVASDDDITILMSYGQIVPSEIYETFNDLYKIIDFISITDDFIASVYIYFENSQFVFSSDGSSMDLNHFYDKSWLNDYNTLKLQKKYWVEARAVDDIFYNTKNRYISSFRTISNYNQNGVVIVNLDTEKMKSVIDNVDDDKNQHNLVIVDKGGTILYNTDSSLISKNISMVKNLKSISYSRTHSYFVRDEAGNQQIVSVLKSGYNDWSYLSISPVSQYSVLTRGFKQFMFIAVTICFLIAVTIAFLISVKIYQPIKNMVSLFKSRSEWEGMLIEDDEKGFNEFKFLTKNILNSFDKTKEMKDVLEERFLLLRKAQSIALQAQINPHFLYNTLETLNWKAMGLTGGENEVSVMIDFLSKLLRLSLETENNIVNIETEIEHVKYYLNIQKLRYKEKFNIIWDMDRNIYEYKIVKLTLQPLVENAIYHGLKPKSGNGMITIRGRESDDHIEIELTDDGVGMSCEDVIALNASMKDEYIKGNFHIGMRNVNQRIKLVFGEQYGITVESERDKYTKIKLMIPKMK
jgi:two-component system sensor histidine kinase YesM